MDALFSDEIAQLLIAPEDSLDIDALILDALNTYETAAKVEISELQHASSATSPSHFSSFVSTSTASGLLVRLHNRSSHAHLHSNMYILNMKTHVNIMFINYAYTSHYMIT